MIYNKCIMSPHCSNYLGTDSQGFNSPPLVGAGMILVDPEQQTMLCVKGTYYHKWGPPKGHLEKNETPEQCAIRELREETGVDGTQLINSKISTKIINGYIFYLIHVDSNQHLAQPEDTREIEASEWLSLDFLRTLDRQNRNIYLSRILTYLD